MAQGNMKTKNIGNLKKHRKEKQKSMGPKKGGKRVIAPKKRNIVQRAELRKTLSKAVNATMEQQLAAKAGSSNLKVINPSENNKTSNKGKKKSNTKDGK